MEPIEQKQIIEKRSLTSFDSPKEMWRFVCSYVHKNRLTELNEFWKAVEEAPNKLNEHFFMREYVWCVYVAGFSAATIGKKFQKLMVAHKIEDEQGKYIPIAKSNLIDPLDNSILSVFGNKRKSTAIQQMRSILLQKGWIAFKESLYTNHDTNYSATHRSSSRCIEPLNLVGLPGIGATLACHLARNLGNQEVVKPDVHLTRLATKYGFANVTQMCRSLSTEPAGRTDLILWIASADMGTL